MGARRRTRAGRLSPSDDPRLQAGRSCAAVVAAALLSFCSTPAALADTASFELNGKIYTKWLYQNDDTRGCLSLSNPFWVDNIGGHNGVCTEFELNIKGRVSRHATAGVRLKSRFGGLWQDWWENGDLRLGTEDTSGESLGLNHAQYIKLRGAFVRIAPPIPTVRWVHVGASDFGMFNAWTIGKSRYIDRDNGYGAFIEGEVLPRLLRYHAAAIALPKLYVGPGWNTGLRDNEPLASFWGQDWAYALKLESQPLLDLQLRAVGVYIQDWEADRYDPDLTGTPDRDRDADHAIDLISRFRAVNGSFEAVYTPAFYEPLTISGLLAYSRNEPNPDYATNLVRNGQGFSPVLFKLDDAGEPVAASGLAGKLLVELADPLQQGLSLKLEYFNIGSEFNAIFGARREADVLLTDGIIPSGFIAGGQLPTLNVANEFVDFDEPWYETVVGWHGLTTLLEWIQGPLRATGEYTYVRYNTDAQGRDIDDQYPSFLYTDGFTDVQAFTADTDYANVFDRGKDPRSVYKEDQRRSTHIAVLAGDSLLPWTSGLSVRAKLKYVHDKDVRRIGTRADNYEGQLFLAFVSIAYQATDELKTSLGYEVQRWIEDNRSGSPSSGYYDYDTRKHTGRLVANYNFGGATFSYLLEYFHKDLERDIPGLFDQAWRVWRSKATLEVSW